MTEQTLTLELLLATVEQTLGPRLPEIGSVLRGPLVNAPSTLPALVLEYADLLPGRDPGSGETALLCRLQARVVVPRDDAEAERLALRCVAELTMALRAQNWGLPLEPASLIRAQPEVDNTALSGCRVWLVEWRQPLLLGEPEWPWEDQPPGSLMLGVDPDTGLGHESDYFAPEAL